MRSNENQSSGNGEVWEESPATGVARQETPAQHHELPEGSSYFTGSDDEVNSRATPSHELGELEDSPAAPASQSDELGDSPGVDLWLGEQDESPARPPVNLRLGELEDSPAGRVDLRLGELEDSPGVDLWLGEQDESPATSGEQSDDIGDGQPSSAPAPSRGEPPKV